MKKNRILLEVIILIGTAFPLIIVYLLKEKAPFIEFDKYLQGSLLSIIFLYFYPLYIYQKNVTRSFSNKINLSFRLSWLLLSIAFGGVFLLHALFPTITFTQKLFLILFGVMFIVEGNYRGLITKNSGIYMGIVDSISDEIIYKKTQRKIGLLQFWLGFTMATFFLLVPKIEDNFIYFIIVFNMILIFVISCIIYKGNKQANNQGTSFLKP